MDKHYKLFTNRQLVALTTFSDLVMEARARVLADARNAGVALGGEVSGSAIAPATVVVKAGTTTVKGSTASVEGSTRSVKGSTTTVEGPAGAENGVSEAANEAERYADAVATYLAFGISKLSDRCSTICTWFTERDSTRSTFTRQALQISWDFAELNTLNDGTGTFSGANEWTAEVIERLGDGVSGTVIQKDAQSAVTALSSQPFMFS
jgi:putative DNA methylase